MKTLGRYKNGNYTVTIYDDGTKVRQTESDDFIPAFPENIDVKLTDKCSVGCPFCFVEDTEISTGEKTKRIQDISVGDVVQSYNEVTNQFEPRKVIQTYKRPYSGKLITIELEDGNVIKCTPNHKIYTTNRGWITADSISENDDIKVYKCEKHCLYMIESHKRQNEKCVICGKDITKSRRLKTCGCEACKKDKCYHKPKKYKK